MTIEVVSRVKTAGGLWFTHFTAGAGDTVLFGPYLTGGLSKLSDPGELKTQVQGLNTRPSGTGNATGFATAHPDPDSLEADDWTPFSNVDFTGATNPTWKNAGRTNDVFSAYRITVQNVADSVLRVHLGTNYEPWIRAKVF